MPEAMAVYRKLLAHFGPQHWWPGDSPFEIIVGAILTQQASWRNVELAIANLKREKMLNPMKLAHAKKEKIEALIRPSGYYRQKAAYLKAFCKYLDEKYDDSLNKLFSKGLGELRAELLELPGIGPETADSILLYAGNKLTFVVDAYTVRVCQRVPLVRIYNEFHALFVALGKNYCKNKKPECRECPLKSECGFAG
jgi:endonuclease-3 related protein